LLHWEQHESIHVGTIRTSSVLSEVNVTEFGNQVLRYIEAHPKVNLLLSFEHVDYLSSTVLTELLRIKRAIDESEGHLRLCAISPVIREVFEITNLDRVFVIHEDGVEEDLHRFRRQLEFEDEDAAWKDH
jgi:anti-anti-sigma factor